MSAAQKGTTQSGRDREEKPKTAASHQRGKATAEPGELPRLGERDGRFYMLFRIAGPGEIPERTHKDNADEVRRQAIAATWRPVDESYTVERDELEGDRHEVVYSIPVEPNYTEQALARRAEREKAERAASRSAKKES